MKNNYIIKRKMYSKFGMMTNHDIENILLSDPATRPLCKGVYREDAIPLFKERCAFVVHVDSHWLAVFMEESEKVQFFDSFGRSPKVFGERVRNFVGYYEEVNHSDFRLQDDETGVCGSYCIYFIQTKCQNRSLFSMVCTLPKLPKGEARDRALYYDVVGRHNALMNQI